MYRQVEFVIYFYIALCASIFLYHAGYALQRRRDAKRQAAYIAAWRQRIATAQSDDAHGALLEKELLRLNHLYAFCEAFTQYRRENPLSAQCYVQRYRKVFLHLAQEYARRPSLHKAYYAYVLSLLQFARDEKFGHALGQVLAEYMADDSVYCRENTLQALYALGDVEGVVRAYCRMNRQNLEHHGKLVTDGLASFQGDTLQLAQCLWRESASFSVSYRVAVIDFLRTVSDSFCSPLAALLQQSGQDDEVRFAVLRYFRKYAYAPVKPYLLRCLTLEERYWHYTALAASALENYPGPDTVQALKRALKSRSWYVRYNATESLVKLQTPYSVLQDIYNGDDRYAREMIQYKVQEQALKQRKA